MKCYNYKENGLYKILFPQKNKGNFKVELRNNNNVVLVQESPDEGDISEVLTLCRTNSTYA